MAFRRCMSALVVSLLLITDLRAEVTFIGQATIPGDATDRSQLTGQLPDGTPHNRLGGMGSAIAYTGRGNTYVMASDRGPHDGAVGFVCRFHFLEIAVTPGANSAVKLDLKSTALMADDKSRQLIGAQSAPFDLRLDPEGVCSSSKGTVYISDEYGPFVGEFSAAGRLIRRFELPKRFLAGRPSATNAEEMPPHGTSGRQSNRGMEGLAISPRGDKLFGLMQSPLLQDKGLDANNARVGTNNRLLEIDIATNKTREFVYPMDTPSNGVSELLAVNDREFLVLERDGFAGAAAKFKKIFKIDIGVASDVSSTDALPSRDLPPSIKPATKTLFLDLLDSRFPITGEQVAEKFEGLAFGPDLPDGRRLLLVTVDNDFLADKPTLVYAFAVDRNDLAAYRPQEFAAQR